MNFIMRREGYAHCWSYLLILALIVFYYVLPKSFIFQVGGNFREFNYFLEPWFIQRYLILIVCVLYVLMMFLSSQVKLTKGLMVGVILSLVLSLGQLLAGEYVFLYAMVGALTSYILFLDIRSNKVSVWFSNLIVIAMFTYVLQYAVYRAGGRITTSFLDPNISGYYLLLAYSVFRFGGYRALSIIALVMGGLSLSRNFYLAVFLFEVLQLSTLKEYLKSFSVFRSPYSIALLSIVTVLIFSVMMLKVSDINSTIGDTSDRLSNINDGSNYSRAKANVDMLERMSEGEFIFIGNGDGVDLKTEHRPHNAFLRAIYRYGLLISLFVIFVSLYVMRIVSENTYPLFISVFAYYTLLNDFITGPEIVLLLAVSAVGSSYLKVKNKLERF